MKTKSFLEELRSELDLLRQIIHARLEDILQEPENYEAIWDFITEEFRKYNETVSKEIEKEAKEAQKIT